MDQGDLRAVRGRLLAVLWERLAELEADAAREAIWQRTDWEKAAGDPCPRCGKPSLRFKDGVCFPCFAHQKEGAYQLSGRLSNLEKRYPKLARGLRRKLAVRQNAEPL